MSHNPQFDRGVTSSVSQPGVPEYLLPDPIQGTLVLGPKTRVGSYSDVYRGTWTYNGEKKVVCIKCLRNTAPPTDPTCPDLTPGERFERVRGTRDILVKKRSNRAGTFLEDKKGDCDLDQIESSQCPTISRLSNHRWRATSCLSMDE